MSEYTKKALELLTANKPPEDSTINSLPESEFIRIGTELIILSVKIRVLNSIFNESAKTRLQKNGIKDPFERKTEDSTYDNILSNFHPKTLQ